MSWSVLQWVSKCSGSISCLSKRGKNMSSIWVAVKQHQWKDSTSQSWVRAVPWSYPQPILPASPKRRSEASLEAQRSDQIRSDQSLSHVRLFATLWIAARQASLSITNSQSSLRLMSIVSVMPSSHLILCLPLLLLPSIPPSIRVFSNESSLHMRWPKYWSFSFNIIPSKENTLRNQMYDTPFPLFWFISILTTFSWKGQT